MRERNAATARENRSTEDADAPARGATADRLRDRADRSGKAVAAVGAATVAGIGLGILPGTFPVVRSDGDLAAVLIVGYYAIALAFAWAAVCLWRAGRPFESHADLEATRAALRSPREVALVRDLHQRLARTHAAPSLLAYAARADRLERIARRRAGTTDAAGLAAEAAAIRAEVAACQERAATMVVRWRLAGSATLSQLVSALLLFAAGLAAMVLSADALAAKRNAAERATECAAAVRALDAADLPASRGLLPAECAAAAAAR